MNWASLLDWIRGNGSKLFVGLTQFITYTVLYLAGKRSSEKEFEAQSNKQALDEAKRVFNEREKIREKYDRLRKSTPNQWMRKTDKD